MALTLDVLRPPSPNGHGILWLVSSGWVSSISQIRESAVKPLLSRGYTVFAVVHGSQPKFTIPEILEDVHRAIRFVRHRSSAFAVDPKTLGVTGWSAGAHLSLMAATDARPGVAESTDLVERESSRVGAAACFFPPTDFLNYGKDGENALGRGLLRDLRAAFDFEVFDRQERVYERISDETILIEIGKRISPRHQISADDAPCLIVHGDRDPIVPLQQSRLFIDFLDEAGVPAELIEHKGGAHGWPGMQRDLEPVADWFDEHLRGLRRKAPRRESPAAKPSK